MQDEVAVLTAQVEALRADVAKLRAELKELRDYIGEVPAMECGITSFEEWREQRD